MKLTKNYLKQIIKEELSILEATDVNYLQKTVIWDSPRYLDSPGYRIYMENTAIKWLADAYEMSFTEMLNNHLMNNENINEYFHRLEQKYMDKTRERISKKDLKNKYIMLVDVVQKEGEESNEYPEVRFYSGDVLLKTGDFDTLRNSFSSTNTSNPPV